MTASRKSTTAKAVEQAHGAATIDMEASFFELPSWQRGLISVIAGAIVAGAGIYVGMTIVTLLTNAALAFTASTFIAWIIYFVGYILTMLGSVLAGLYVQHMVLEGGAAKMVSDKVNGAASRMGAWFSAIKTGA